MSTTTHVRTFFQPPDIYNYATLVAVYEQTQDSDPEFSDWQYIHDSIEDFMGDHQHWKVEVINFGWRKIHGFKFFRATTAADLLLNILPKADNQFRIYRGSYGELFVNNSHHDSPGWDEWYQITKVKEEDFP